MIRPKNITHADFFCILSSNLDKNTRVFQSCAFFAHFPRQNLCSQTSSLVETMNHFGNVGKYILHQVLQLLIERFWILHTLKPFLDTYNFEIVYPVRFCFWMMKKVVSLLKSPHTLWPFSGAYKCRLDEWYKFLPIQLWVQFWTQKMQLTWVEVNRMADNELNVVT